MAACLFCKSLRLSRPQAVACRCVWRELTSWSSMPAGGSKKVTENRPNWGHIFCAPTEHLGLRGIGGCLSSGGARNASSSTTGECTDAGESPTSEEVPSKGVKGRKKAVPGKRVTRKGGKAKATTADDTAQHEQESASEDRVTIATSELEAELEVMGADLEGAQMSYMREEVGKGKVEITPIAVLHNKEELAPLTYQLGSKLKLDSETIRQKKPGLLKGKHVFTNENIVADEFDYNAASREAADPKESLPADLDPRVRDLVSYLMEEVGLKKKDKTLYLNSAPSVLGVSLKEVRQQVGELEALGFTKGEVASIVPLFPSSIAMDWANVREIYQFLRKDLKMVRGVVYSLMKQHPFMFGVPYSKVCECLRNLQSLKLPPREIASILNHAPLLACVPMTKKTLKALQEFLQMGLGYNSLQYMLFQTVFFRPSHVELTDNTALLTTLLHSYEADPKIVLSKFPLFFQQDGKKLEAVIAVMCGSPLYLDIGDITHFLEKAPIMLFSIQDTDALRKHVGHLCKLFSNNASTTRTKLKNSPSLLSPACAVKYKYRALTSFGFTSDEACSLLTKVPSVLTQHLQDELQPKLDLLKKVPDVDPAYLTKKPRVLQVPVDVVTARLKFAAKHQPDLLVAAKLEDVLLTSHEVFAELCDCPPEDYYREALLEQKAADQKKRQRLKLTRSKIIPPSESAILGASQSLAVADNRPPVTSQPPSAVAEEQHSFPPLLQDTPQALPGTLPMASRLATSEPSMATSGSATIASAEGQEEEVQGTPVVATLSTSPHHDTSAATPAVCTEEILDSAFMEEVPDLLPSVDQPLSSDDPLPSQDLEADLLACPILSEPPIEDPPIDELESDELEGVNVDDFIAKELEDLMSKLCSPGLMEYRVPAGEGGGALGFVPLEELLEYPDICEEQLMAQPLKHRSL